VNREIETPHRGFTHCVSLFHFLFTKDVWLTLPLLLPLVLFSSLHTVNRWEFMVPVNAASDSIVHFYTFSVLEIVSYAIFLSSLARVPELYPLYE
jgi:hypothetical protein